jgi:hypothetical protein
MRLIREFLIAATSILILLGSAQAQAVTIGETSVLSSGDSGNGNLLLAQSANLAQAATIQSLSFYVTAASGSLILGICNATGPNGGPGALKAATASFTPVTGWNTAKVVTRLSLASGSYWLAYLPSSNLGGQDQPPYNPDPNSATYTFRDGNYDYYDNAIQWASSDTSHTLPNSLYLSSEPSFFTAGSGSPWPWITPTGSTQVLPDCSGSFVAACQRRLATMPERRAVAPLPHHRANGVAYRRFAAIWAKSSPASRMTFQAETAGGESSNLKSAFPA